MAQLQLVSELYKGSEAQFGTEPKWIWQDDAACAFMDPNLFELKTLPADGRSGLSFEQLRELQAENKEQNLQNFKQAQKACFSCPVIEQCREAATTSDRTWTVRAGQLPVGFNPILTSAGEAKPQYRKNSPDKPCKRNHDLKEWSWQEGNQRYRCNACRQEGKGNGHASKIDPTKPCKNGHEPNYGKRKDGGGTYYCRTCSTERSLRSKAARMAR